MLDDEEERKKSSKKKIIPDIGIWPIRVRGIGSKRGGKSRNS